MSREEAYLMVIEQVITPKVVVSFSLYDSIFHRSRIEPFAREKYPDSELVFRKWLTSDFLKNPMSSKPELGGVRTALLGSLNFNRHYDIFRIPNRRGCSHLP